MLARTTRLTLIALCAASCGGAWQSVRSDHPATPAELSEFPISVQDPAIAQALASRGFKVVSRNPYQGELLLTVRIGPNGATVELTSDGFFIDRWREPLPLDAVALAGDVAASDRLAWVAHNGGTVEQLDVMSQ